MSTSNARIRPARAELLAALINAGREYSTAAVMLHSAVAEALALGITEIKTLDLLQRSGPLTAGEIAARTGLATASVTSLIDRLVKKRFVQRRRDRTDRRRVVVNITVNVDRKIAPLFQSLNRRMRSRFEAFNEEQIALIEGFLMSGAQEMREEATRCWASRRGRW